MRCAIYCRKSTEQTGVDEREKSVAHQRERCQELIHARGWTLAEGHVYTDDGVSGAVFGESRPALAHLMDAIKATARSFDVVVAYDDSRLGRDIIETGYLVKQIIDADVRLFFADGTERRLDSATDALMMSIQNFGGQFERERASVRTKDKMRAKAKEGHSTGGTAPLGYRTVSVNSHKELVIEPTEAEIVQRIFTLYASGHGINRIAHTLNREHPGLRKWSAPTVRDILSNEVYEGIVIYGKTRAVVKGGKASRVAVPESEWVRVEKPELQVVPEALVRAVRARHSERRGHYLRARNGTLQGRPDSDSKFLLQGMVTCDLCGGKMVVWSTSKKGTDYRYLTCWRHKSSGPAACPNARTVRADWLTDQVVTALKQRVSAESIEQAVRGLSASDDCSPERVAVKRELLKGDLGRLERRISKLVEEIVEATDTKALHIALKAAETQHEELLGRLRQLDTAQAVVADWTTAGHRERVESILTDWQAALDGEPVLGRQVLRKLLVMSILVRPGADGGVVWVTAGTFGHIIGQIGGEEPAVATFLRPGATPADLSAELKALAEAVGQQEATGGRTS